MPGPTVTFDAELFAVDSIAIQFLVTRAEDRQRRGRGPPAFRHTVRHRARANDELGARSPQVAPRVTDVLAPGIAHDHALCARSGRRPRRSRCVPVAADHCSASTYTLAPLDFALPRSAHDDAQRMRSVRQSVAVVEHLFVRAAAGHQQSMPTSCF